MNRQIEEVSASLAAGVRPETLSLLASPPAADDERDFLGVQGDRFCDVDFRQLVKEPCKVVKDIYAHFGYDFSPEFEQRIEAYMSKCDPAQSLFCFICGPNVS